MSDFEWSHGRRRKKSPRVLGNDAGVQPMPEASGEPVPVHAPGTTLFGAGNQGYRLRMLKRKAAGIHTLNPASCPEWLRPSVEDGQGYALELLKCIGASPVLTRLAGDVADAHSMYRALLGLAAKGDPEALREARQWLREHRTALATLAGLAAESLGEGDDPTLEEDAGAKP